MSLPIPRSNKIIDSDDHINLFIWLLLRFTDQAEPFGQQADLSVDDCGILNPATPEDLAGLGEPGMVRQIRRIIGVCHRLDIVTCQC